MIGFLKKFFSATPKADYKTLVNEGAKIIDVRTKAEFNSGHLKNAINIPLDVIKNNVDKIDKDQTIIVCCASGMRSAGARSILRQKGFRQVYNGGSWIKLKEILE